MRLAVIKLFSLLIMIVLISSCKKPLVFGEVAVNTERPIVEFSDPHGFKSISMDYFSGLVTLDITDIRFMIRSVTKQEATAKIALSTTAVNSYNVENGTNYTPVPVTKVSLEKDQFSLSPAERSKTVSIRINPSDIATGDNAIGITIAMVNGAEASQIAGTLVIALSVKNKYDGVYHLKGHFTRIDNPAINGPFETDVEMITTGINSVAMYWPDGGDFYQPFANNGSLTAFANVAPEVYFNTTDQVTNLVNITGDPVSGPFMTVFPGSNSRFVAAPNPVIYLKYYYNTNPANRIFADTLTYTGSR